MQIPLQITFRNISHSAAVEEKIREKIDKLEDIYQGITGCRVVVETAYRHSDAKLFHIRIDLTLPRGELVVAKNHNHVAYNDIYVAIRDAFSEVKRQLKDYAQRQHGFIKAHDDFPYGQVKRLLPDRDCGFIETSEGEDIYFHRNSVLNNGYDRLKPGTKVYFAEEEGEKGPQASTVKIAGKHYMSLH